jgi:hypothetical protein
MNRKSLLSLSTLAIALIGSGAAFAQEATSDTWTQAAGNKSRVQVNAELQQARSNGSILAGERAYIEPARSVASRATVQAEAVAALRSGEAVAALRSGEAEVINAQAYAFAPTAVVAPTTLLAGK